MSKKNTPERRSYERFAVASQPDKFVPPHCPGVGTVVDISMGGLSFIYDGHCLPENVLSHIDIFFGNDICCLKDIPCRLLHGDGNVLPDRINSIGRIQFGELSQKQKVQLEYLIKINARPESRIT